MILKLIILNILFVVIRHSMMQMVGVGIGGADSQIVYGKYFSQYMSQCLAQLLVHISSVLYSHTRTTLGYNSGAVVLWAFGSRHMQCVFLFD